MKIDLKNKFKNKKSWLFSLALSALSVSLFGWLFSGALQNFKQTPSTVADSITGNQQVLGVQTSIQPALNIQAEPEQIRLSLDKIQEASISAKSYLVFNLNTGTEILTKNSKLKLPVASLTKLMTGFVSYKYLKMSDFLEIKQNLTQTKPYLGLKIGQKYKVEDLFSAMIIGSANDAGQALAKWVEENSGSKFSDLMNNEAKQLGMSDTNFSNPNGFDSVYNYSTAADIKKIITATQKIYAFNSLGKRQSYEFQSSGDERYKILTTNKLLKKNPDISSVKTGYTEGSLGSMAIKFNIKGQDYIFLVIGSKNRENDIQILINKVTEYLN